MSAAKTGRLTDQDVEQVIGNLLRTGVSLSAIIVMTGGAIYLVRNGYALPEHHVFQGEPRAWSTLGGLFSRDTLAHGRGIIMLGLLVLILTPVARVAFSLVAFAVERDWLYVGITAIVLALLSYGLLSA